MQLNYLTRLCEYKQPLGIVRYLIYKVGMENTFIKTGIYTNGCLIPVTTENPDLVVKETKLDTKRWGIGFFLGDECIGLINTDTNLTSLHKSILTCSVYRDSQYVGSVGNRLKLKGA